ncbi:CPBP family glutamic-type intramembrane protease [Chitinophaga lutea]
MYIRTLKGLSLNGAWRMQLRLYACWIAGAAIAWLLSGGRLLESPSLLLTVFVAGGAAVILDTFVRLKENFHLVPRIQMTAESFLLAFSMALALVVVRDALGYLLPLPVWYELSFTAVSTGSLYAVLLSVILSSFMLEMLYRGVIMAALLERYSAGVALLQSTILYTLAHPDPSQMPGALLLGLLCGYFYLRQRDLCSCFLIHLTHNAALAMLAGSGSLQFVHTDPGTYTALVLACLGALVAGCFILRRISPGRAEAHSPQLVPGAARVRG